MAEKTVTFADPFEEKKRVYVPRIPGDDSDLFVAVNGRHYLIRRGEDVEVPAPVAAVIANSEYAARVSDIRLDAEQAKFNARP